MRGRSLQAENIAYNLPELHQVRRHLIVVVGEEWIVRCGFRREGNAPCCGVEDAILIREEVMCDGEGLATQSF